MATGILLVTHDLIALMKEHEKEEFSVFRPLVWYF